MKKIAFLCSAFYLFCYPKQSSSHYDLTVASPIKFADAIQRLGIGFMDALKDDLTINHINTREHIDFADINEHVKKIIINPDKTPGNVVLFCDLLWTKSVTPANLVPKNSHIKIAYSMFELSTLPRAWVDILNSKFDLVAVPDETCRSLYKDCGVTIPIFVMPLGIYVEDLLSEPAKVSASRPFTFGLSAGFWERKNQELLVDAFRAEFGNDPKVKLKLHGRMADADVLNKILAKIKLYRVSNIEIIHKSFNSVEYKNFLKTLDCMVVLSRAEGFSIPPREALSLGLPCIVSNNTAHKLLCKTDFFKCVPSSIQHRTVLDLFGGLVGYDFDCSITSVRAALRDVYINYGQYLERARQGRVWVQTYLWKNLKSKLLNLIKPEKILLGDTNDITDEFLMTNSPALYEKYAQLIKKNTPLTSTVKV